MRFVGLDVSREVSRDGDEVLLKLAAKDELLEEIAEQVTMEKRLKAGGYTDFAREQKKLFVPASATSFFSSLERQRLILALLELGLSEGGCDLDLDVEIEKKVLTAIVPVHEPTGRGHDTNERAKLMDSWCLAPLHWWPSQPLDDVKEYFGERMALYFAFLQHLTRGLLMPSAIGLVVVLYGILYGSADNPLTPFYSIFMMLWLPWFCKTWRREEARLAFKWNVEDFEEAERERPQFRGPPARGFYSAGGHFIDVDEEDRLGSAAPLIKKFTPEERQSRVAFSYGVIMPIVVVVMIGVVALLAYRSFLQISLSTAQHIALGPLAELDFEPNASALPAIDSDDVGTAHVHLAPSYAVTIGSVIGAGIYSVWISATNYIYSLVAVRLNDWENHRTQTEYEDALIIKTFCFQFINSYISLFYIAFLKASQVGLLPGMSEFCHDVSHFDYSPEHIKADHSGTNPFCMAELSTMLTSLVVFSQLIAKVTEYVLPKVYAIVRRMSEEYGMRRRGGKVTSMSTYEEQVVLEPHEGCFSEYLFLVTQLGYVVLFAPAFPIAALVCYASFLLEIRTDAYKLLVNTQRPRYAGAQDIGSWLKVLWFLCVVGVFTNMGIIGLTSSSFALSLPMNILGLEINDDNKLFYLFLFEHSMLGAQYIILNVLPDVPPALAIARAKVTWRKRATLEVFKAGSTGSKPMVVEGIAKPVRAPHIEWDDDAIPERFWHDARGQYVEPKQVREWTKLLKAGEWIAEQKIAEKAKEANLVRYHAERDAAEAKASAQAAKDEARAQLLAVIAETPGVDLAATYGADQLEAGSDVRLLVATTSPTSKPPSGGRRLPLTGPNSRATERDLAV